MDSIVSRFYKPPLYRGRIKTFSAKRTNSILRLVAVMCRPFYWAERRVAGRKLFRKSKWRWLWCFLFVASRKQVQTLFFALVMLLLLRHLYFFGMSRPESKYKAGPVHICGPSVADRAVERFKTWKEACNLQNLREQDAGQVRNHFYTDRNKKLLFCSVPGMMDTFWKRIIRFVNNGSRSIHGSPFDIPKWQTYYLARSDLRETPHSAIRFMVAQDPYVRLWHTWIQKFFLMGYWFRNFGFVEEGKCQSNVSFPQFLGMVTLQENLDHPAHLDIHWRPQVYICDVCWVEPAYLAKMETFQEDAVCLLSMTNYSWVFDGDAPATLSDPSPGSMLKYRLSPIGDRQTSMRNMRTLAMENFARWYLNPAAQKCISLTGLVKRLWKAFQYSGYLPSDLALPPTLLSKEEISVKDLLTECSRGIFKWTGTNIRARQAFRRAQFREHVVHAYAQVPTQTLEMMELLYAADFTSLGYEPRPDDIFDPRYMSN